VTESPSLQSAEAPSAHDEDGVQAEVDRPATGPATGEPAGAPEPARPARLSSEERLAELELEGEIAADYLEGLLDIVDLDGDIDMDVENDRATVSIVGADLSQLVGPGGRVLEALQELTRLAVQARTGERSRLMLDVSGHRAQRREQLRRRAERVVDECRRTGAPVRLDPMNAFERKVIHDVVAAAGLRSESEGTDPERYVVVYPA